MPNSYLVQHKETLKLWKIRKSIKHLIKISNLGPKNGPVGWNGLFLSGNALHPGSQGFNFGFSSECSRPFGPYLCAFWALFLGPFGPYLLGPFGPYFWGPLCPFLGAFWDFFLRLLGLFFWSFGGLIVGAF